jgi:hypothetical protein
MQWGVRHTSQLSGDYACLTGSLGLRLAISGYANSWKESGMFFGFTRRETGRQIIERGESVHGDVMDIRYGSD